MVRKSQTLANGRAATRTAAHRTEALMSGALQRPKTWWLMPRITPGKSLRSWRCGA